MMVHPNMRREIEDKMQALSRVLDEVHSSQGTEGRERAIEALVDLIKAVWPALLTSSQRTQVSTRLSKLVRDIANLLRSEAQDEQSLSSPHRNQSENSFPISPDSPYTIDENVASSTGNGGHVASGSQPDVGEPGLLDFVISDADLAAIFGDNQFPGETPNANTTAVPGGTSIQDDFSSLLALVADMEDPEPFPGLGSSVSMDDILFVPQSTPDGTSFPPLPSLPSPAIDEDWLAGNNTDHPLPSDHEGPTTLDNQRGTATDDIHAAVATANALALVFVSTTEPILADEEELSHVDTLESEAESQLGIERELRELTIILETEGSADISLDWILPSHQFRCTWAIFDGIFVRNLLEQLTRPDKAIGEETVEYFVRKLAAVQNASETWIGRGSSLKDLRQSPQRVLIMLNECNEWSLIEIQCHIGRLTHYRCCATPPPYDHGDCSPCNEAAEYVSILLRQEGKLVPTWNRLLKNVAAGHVGDGLWLVWVTRLRAERIDPTESVPAGYRSTLAREILHDFNAAESSDALLKVGMPGNLPTPDDAPISAETYWTDFGNQNGFGTRLCDKVRQLAIKPGAKSDEPIGLYRASELVQLAVNIGSPDVLISLKECLRHLRAQLASSSHSYPETPWGTYDAYCGHQRSENLSTIGMRLSNWRLQLWKKEHTDNIEFVIDLILSGKPPSTSVSRKVIRDRLKDKKASYWCHLVDYVGNQDPNILCLLPRKATIGPPRWPKNLNSTSYRDLSVRECKLLGEVYADLRPQVLRSADKDLSKDLLYVRDPEGVYRVEDLSYEEIKEHELSSDFFVGILQKAPATDLTM